jgi:hypothetical protein
MFHFKDVAVGDPSSWGQIQPDGFKAGIDWDILSMKKQIRSDHRRITSFDH